jgi:putative heme iron utilization protein
MNAEMTEALARLLRARTTAALGTLHAGAPYVSMVPFAIAAEGFLVHVSTLAAHTKDMLADARVSLLVAEAQGEAKSPLGLERVSVQATAERIAADAPQLPEFRSAYLTSFPDAGQMFGFADFSMFLIRPGSARFVAGFGQAHSLSAESLLQILRR